MNISDIKDIAIIAEPFIAPLVATILKPKLKGLEGWLKRKNIEQKVIDNYWDDKFEDYLLRAYQKFININVLVFPNQQINIKDIYCPLSIASVRDYRTFQIQSFSKEMIEPYQKILISDAAGMGKSTLMKWIGLSIIESKLSIPILIELRKLNKSNTILNEIYNQIDPIEKKFDRELILQFLKLGCFTILFDGFDEILSEERENVIIDLKDFISKANNNWFVLTSRPDSSLSTFGDFQMFRIRPLTENESFNLIKRYDDLNPNKISEKLIDDIKEKYQQVKEFLINPFLVSLLYKSYTYNKDIPSKKSTFYDEVYCALYKHHDLSKDGFKRNKKSGLDIHDFRLVLQNLAFNTAKEIKVEYSESELINRIRNTQKYFPSLNYKPLRFMEDLESTVPLFTREGNSIKWAHKSIQDYFAAEFISNHQEKEKIIELIYNSQKENYSNILDFLYEMEINLFRKIILRDILIKFISYCDKSDEKFKTQKKSQTRIRQAITFLVLFAILHCKNDLDFPETREILRKEYPDFNYKLSTRQHLSETYLYKFYDFNFIYNILNIIAQKNENLFIKIGWVKGDFNVEELTDNKPYILDFEDNSILNSKNNFEKTNNIILSDLRKDRHFGNLYLLDYAKCKNILFQIDEEIKNENSVDVLGGI